MIPGSTVRVGGVDYELVELLAPGACAQAFRAQAGARHFVIKVYPVGARAAPNARGKKNHYGRMRDVSDVVFDEVRAMSERHRFLPVLTAKERVHRRWYLVMEYVEGERLSEFLRTAPREAGEAACELLGQALREWHAADIAHGDAHLENALVATDDGRPRGIRLIDIDMIHHPEFTYCAKLACVFDRARPDNRFLEDLRNDDGKIGRGFLNALEGHGEHGSSFTAAFLEGYR